MVMELLVNKLLIFWKKVINKYFLLMGGVSIMFCKKIFINSQSNNILNEKKGILLYEK